MATKEKMMTTANLRLSFEPRTVFHTEGFGRQLDFTLSRLGTVSVNIRYGLAKINTLSQNQIYVQPNSRGVRRPQIRTLANMSPSEKSYVLEAIENDTVEMNFENGKPTNILKRNTVGEVFFHKIDSITLTLQ
jgi:hypothetical protein